MVRLYIGITDRDWFEALAPVPPDEVDFWQPSGSKLFRALRPGELFLFKVNGSNYRACWPGTCSCLRIDGSTQWSGSRDSSTSMNACGG